MNSIAHACAVYICVLVGGVGVYSLLNNEELFNDYLSACLCRVG